MNHWRWSSAELDKTVGLILCEEIWPHDRLRWRIISEYHASVARALMSQWGNATTIMVLRSSNAKALSVELGHVKRITYHYGDAFKLHYQPLIMNGLDPPSPVVGCEWCAVVIHPTRDRLITSTGRLFIPELVFKAMLSKKSTLQLCAYTCESTIQCMQYLKDILELHGV